MAKKRFSLWRMEFLHPAMWHAGGFIGWHAIEFARAKRPPYWNSTSGFDFGHNTAVNMSFGTSLQNCIQIGPTLAEKMTSCRFSSWRISAILNFRGSIVGSLKSPCTTSYRSSIEIIALNCLVFEKIAFLPRDAMHKRGLCRYAVSVCLSVYLSVCVSVTFVDHVKTNKHIFEFFTVV